MASSFDYDLFVIGGGSGGVRAARIAAGYGARVALAEASRVGGTCVIRGCIPKKLLVYAARFADEFADAAGYGWTVAPPTFDWPALIASKDREIDRLNAAYTRTLEKAGVTILHTRAVLEDRNRLRLGDGRTVTAATILVATGGHPFLDPAVAGIEHAISSDAMFHLPELPRRLAIVGGGYTAVEFASLMRGFGVEVTLFYRGDEILRGFDDDIRTALHGALKARGIGVHCHEVLTAIEPRGDHLTATTSQGAEIFADQILYAIGRRPNTAGLGLEAAGVVVDANGAIKVDRFSKTSADNIFAVGDVTNRLNLTPVAIREGHAFADSVFGGRAIAVDHDNVPTAVFSTPEVGAVGMTETVARERLSAVDIYRTTFTPMRNQLSGRAEKVLMKLVVDGETDRLLGCHILGPDAAEMAQLMAVPIHLGARKADLDATMALHPTLAEELVTMRTPTERHRRAAAE